MTSVLVIEDDERLANTLCKMFQQDESEAETATSLQQARTALREKAFDLVTIDLMMPGGCGSEIVELIRQSQPGVRIIVISGILAGLEDQGAMGEKVRKDIAADAFVSKPFKLTEVRDAVRKVMEAES